MRVGSVVVLCAVIVGPVARAEAPKIGDRIDAPPFKDTRYLTRTLDDFGKREAFVVVAIRTSCPLARQYLPVLADLERQYRARGVQFLALDVAPDESVAEAAAMAIDAGAEFPVGHDDGAFTKAVGWTRTPEVVVLDAERVLRYRGRIDDQLRLGGARPEATRRDLAEALDELLAGRPVTTPETTVDGCLITTTTPIGLEGPPPTFHESIEPILQKHCQECHRPNTEAPFSLLTHRDAVVQADMIAEVVADRRMPPWYAAHDPVLVNRRGLSATERETLLAWIKAGLPKGDSSKRPAPREFPTSEWRIGEPDQVITMTGTHEVPATGYVDYKYVVFPFVFAADTWLHDIEIKPDNPRVVHHANLAFARMMEGAKPTNFITGRVPGGDPMVLDEGVAYLIPAGSVLGLQVHYTTTGKPERCQISVGLKFPREKVRKRLYHCQSTTGKFEIPPFAPAHEVKAERELAFDASLIGVFAHMHVRGKDMQFLAHRPGEDAERLVLVPNYHFDWQQSYRWAPGTKKLPKGTRLEARAHFDNSTFNPYNPDPSAAVREGDQTYQEMMYGFFFYTRDDEDLDLTIDPKTGRVVK
jgi:hypothetical protein